MIHKKILSIFALLLMVATGAWAQTTVKYALSKDDAFASGQTVNVKDDADAVVATITYGESGGADFKAAKETTAASALTGYTAYTEGNGTNGDKSKGTFYTIVPEFNGTIDVAVILNADKAFYILEDGTALDGYNGITVGAKYYGTYSFSVSAGKSYKIYCAASKLGFYGFEYTFTPAATIDVTPTANANEWTFDMPAYDVVVNVEYDTDLALSEETDNVATLAEWDGYEADVTLTRTLQTGGWNTFAVPFDISATNYAVLQGLLTAQGASISVKQLSSSAFDAGTLTLNFTDATEIVAGKPYLVKVSKNFDLATLPAAIDAYAQLNSLSIANPFKNVVVSKTLVPTETTAVDFIPTLGLTEISGNANEILFLSSGNTLLHPESLPSNMKGFRAYFQLKGDAVNARSFNIDFGDGNATGIKSIEKGQTATDNAIYDLQGRRVNGTAQKGVYIVNGKKTIIK